jgi:hypothetical protein
MTRGEVRVVLELESGSAETISGVLVGPSGEGRPFYGWIRLIALLDSARTKERRRDAATGGNTR